MLKLLKIKDYYIPETDLSYQAYFQKFDHYQEAQRNRAVSHVDEWEFAIDIGANIGLWAKDLSKYFNNIVCFEPNPFCHECLKKNITLENSKIYPYGLGEKEETRELFVDLTKLGGSSFINKTKIGFNQDGSKIYGEFGQETVKKNIEIKKLDDFDFKKINFIKIDVQGYELNVLKGAQNTLINNNPVICLEEEDPKNKTIINFLKNLNYDLVDVILKEQIFKKNN